MKINIVSTDNRYAIVNELLQISGYDSYVCTVETYDDCDYLILSVRNELTEDELKALFAKVDGNTIVLSGNKTRIERHFDGKIIDYSQNDLFVSENARLTAEATLSYLHTLTKASIRGKSIFVSGYGRIGRDLCLMLKSIGCDVFAFARRQEVIEKMASDGIPYASLDKSKDCNIILNTVPSNIYSGKLIDSIPTNVYLVELASYPYGFENMDRVNMASGLPGKVLPKSAAQAVYDTVNTILSSAGKG